MIVVLCGVAIGAGDRFPLVKDGKAKATIVTATKPTRSVETAIENFCGVRIFMPRENGAVAPETLTLCIPDDGKMRSSAAAGSLTHRLPGSSRVSGGSSVAPIPWSGPIAATPCATSPAIARGAASTVRSR